MKTIFFGALAFIALAGLAIAIIPSAEAVLTGGANTPSDSTAGVPATQNIAFTTAAATGITGKIVISVPAGMTGDPDALAIVSPPTAGIWTAGRSADLITLTESSPGTGLLADTQYLVIISGLSNPQTAGDYTVTVETQMADASTVDGPDASDPFTIVAGLATQLVMATEPGGATSGAVMSTQPLVHVRDQFGNVVAASTATVTAAGAGANSGALAGTLAQDAVAGVVTFTDLIYTAGATDGEMFTIDFTSVLLSAAASTPAASDVVATKFLVTTQPAGSVSGIVLATQPIVEARDANDMTDTGFVGDVVVSEAAAGGLTGTITKAAVAGVATFADVVYSADADQETFQLTFVSTGLTSVTSSDVVSDVVATKLAVASQPGGSVSGAVLVTQPVVQARDANDKLDTDFVANVVVAEDDEGVLAGTLTQAAVAGVATFTDLGYTATVDQEVFQLDFSSSVAAVSSGDVVSDVVATKLKIVTAPANIVSGVGMTQPGLYYVGAGDVTDIGINGDVVTVAQTGAGSLAGTLTATATSGVVIFTDLVYSATVDGEVLTLSFVDDVGGTVNAASGVASGSITADVVATRFVISPAGPGSVASPVTVEVVAKDAAGTQDDDYVADVRLTTTGSATGGGIVDIIAGSGTLVISNAVAETILLGLDDSQGTSLDASSTQPLIFDIASASTFLITLPGTVATGANGGLTLTAQDAGGNTVATYIGTVHFTTTDTASAVVLPADYTFSGADNGVKVFDGFTSGQMLKLITPGDQSVTATDTVTNSVTATKSFVASFAWNLQAGWNFVSIPKELVGSSLSAAFTDVASVDRVYYYNAATEAYEQATFDGSTWAGGLATLTHGKGYWVHATGPVDVVLTLKPDDPVATPPSYAIGAGWNMVGYTTMQLAVTLDVGTYLNSLDGKWSRLYQWDSEGGYKFAAPGTEEAVPNVEIGRGYWIFATQAGTLAA